MSYNENGGVDSTSEYLCKTIETIELIQQMCITNKCENRAEKLLAEEKLSDSFMNRDKLNCSERKQI